MHRHSGRLLRAGAVILLTGAVPGAAAIAQPAAAAEPAPMQGMAMPEAGDGEASMTAAMDRMSKAMAAAPMTGDADQDFVAMMLPHHQGAVDMARFELAHGKDPAMRKLAHAIVAAQEKEMAQMTAWQSKKHPAKP